MTQLEHYFCAILVNGLNQFFEPGDHLIPVYPRLKAVGTAPRVNIQVSGSDQADISLGKFTVPFYQVIGHPAGFCSHRLTGG